MPATPKQSDGAPDTGGRSARCEKNSFDRGFLRQLAAICEVAGPTTEDTSHQVSWVTSTD